MKLLVATNNKNKLREIRKILSNSSIELIPLSEFPDLPEPPETQNTFQGNALQKARFVAESTSLLVISDDSGLEVDALGGRPGVHSKRYSQEATASANNQKLLKEMQGEANRNARFQCAIAIVAGKKEKIIMGKCEGSILHSPKGDGGFGYDPVFAPLDYKGKSMAQLSPDEKNHISHRANALKQLHQAMLDMGLII